MTPSLPAQYRVVKVLGAGAAGEVFLVENQHTGRAEALKVMKPVGSGKEEEVAHGRFKREVRAAQRLDHQNIVQTYDAGTLPDGRLYMTMEYVDGVALSSLVHSRGPLSIALALGILAEAADAVHHAHTAGVAHRDIKPHNLVLAKHPHGQIVKILDFGIAKILDPSLKESKQLTADGAIMGTPEYMAPEQCRGSPPDRRSDIYALGCVAFELLLGEPPFRGKIAPLFAAHLTKPPRVPSAVDPDARIPPALDAVILCCLEKLPDRRFQHGAALCVALQGVPGYRPLRVPPVS